MPHLRRFDPRQTPPVQLEYAIYALQRARDDAHIAAWRDAGLTGPMIELLSRVWTDTTTTVDHLAEHARGRMLAADVTETVEKLKRASCIVVNSITITITRFGRDVRDWIEDEADRMYFAPWPEIDGIRDKPDRSSRNRNPVPARHGFGDSAERCWILATLSGCGFEAHRDRLCALSAYCFGFVCGFLLRCGVPAGEFFDVAGIAKGEEEGNRRKQDYDSGDPERAA